MSIQHSFLRNHLIIADINKITLEDSDKVTNVLHEEPDITPRAFSYFPLLCFIFNLSLEFNIFVFVFNLMMELLKDILFNRQYIIGIYAPNNKNTLQAPVKTEPNVCGYIEDEQL